MSTTTREQSDQLKVAAAERVPSEVMEVFNRNIQEMGDKGVPANTIQVGDQIESFYLDDATGHPVSLEDVLKKGVAVIVFHRGGWCP